MGKLPFQPDCVHVRSLPYVSACTCARSLTPVTHMYLLPCLSGVQGTGDRCRLSQTMDGSVAVGEVSFTVTQDDCENLRVRVVGTVVRTVDSSATSAWMKIRKAKL